TPTYRPLGLTSPKDKLPAKRLFVDDMFAFRDTWSDQVGTAPTAVSTGCERFVRLRWGLSRRRGGGRGRAPRSLCGARPARGRARARARRRPRAPGGTRA